MKSIKGLDKIIIIGLLIGIVFMLLGTGWHYLFSSTGEVSEHLISEEIKATVISVEKKEKPVPREVKGIYLTANSAANTTKRNEMIDLIKSTELNAVVIDIKDYSGRILYDSNLLVVNELDTDTERMGNTDDVKAIIDEFHKNDIYVIARQTVFQDPILSQVKPEWAVKNASGGIWHDYKGLSWVDATNKGIWRYNVAIAKEAIRLGFDEINFDYVRFPSDGNISAMRFVHLDRKKYEVMGDFFEFLDDELSDEPAWISIDMFGFVMERFGENDLSIGQRLDDALDHIDYISPMMYPSHYPSGHLGLANPAASPALVIANGMEKGLPRFEGKRAHVRPWIQAFNIGAQYGAVNIRAQIDEIEKRTDDGWLLWNAANRYSSAGLKIAEVTPEVQ